MSAYGTKQTSLDADECPLLGVKRTSLIGSLMSANDPKRTFQGPSLWVGKLDSNARDRQTRQSDKRSPF